MKDKISHFIHTIDLSALLTVIGIIILFSTSIAVILIAPNFVDPTWINPSSRYQVQMYEVSDPHFYLSSAGTGGQQLSFVHHLKKNYSLLAFKESEAVKILPATPDLEKYITKEKDPKLKLTSRLLLLREKTKNPNPSASYITLELFDPKAEEAFALATSDGVIQDWVDQNFTLLESPQEDYQKDPGVIYVSNPVQFRVTYYKEGGKDRWKYDSKGQEVKNLQELTSPPLSFTSRKELIAEGEHIYAIEGCWYCHTDQTRTLIQDLVLNGSDSYPAPPSAPNEYVYNRITFPGTKRNGPDMSRVAVKRPNRDWHKGHFWAPKTSSVGSIMPSFRHFFDNSPQGTSSLQPGVPNRKFEAIYQYLMTKGTRITPPTEAWWLGKDPIQTKEIIEGRKTLP